MPKTILLQYITYVKKLITITGVKGLFNGLVIDSNKWTKKYIHKYIGV